MKQCYYELLEIDKKATSAEIKTVILTITVELQEACTEIPS